MGRSMISVRLPFIRHVFRRNVNVGYRDLLRVKGVSRRGPECDASSVHEQETKGGRS